MVNSQQYVFLKCQSKVLVFFLFILQSPQSPFWHCFWIRSILSVLTILIIPKVAAHINTQSLVHTCTQTHVHTGTHARTHAHTDKSPVLLPEQFPLPLFFLGEEPSCPLTLFLPHHPPTHHSASLMFPRPWSQGDFHFSLLALSSVWPSPGIYQQLQQWAPRAGAWKTGQGLNAAVTPGLPADSTRNTETEFTFKPALGTASFQVSEDSHLPP